MTISPMLQAIGINPGVDAEKIGHKAGDVAGEDGGIAQDNVLVVHLHEVALRHH